MKTVLATMSVVNFVVAGLYGKIWIYYPRNTSLADWICAFGFYGMSKYEKTNSTTEQSANEADERERGDSAG